jgi:hypothetical protein
MRETKAECFIVRRSFLELMKDGSATLSELKEVEGREMRPDPDCEGLLEVLERMEGRFLGVVGPCVALVTSFGMVEKA